MSEPIILGGPPPSNDDQNGKTQNDDLTKDKNTQNGNQNEEMKPEEKENQSNNGAPIALGGDDVKIGDEEVTKKDIDAMFGDEKPKRKSRWGTKEEVKKKVQQDVVFNPYQALTGGSHLIAITDGTDVNKAILGLQKTEEPEPKKKLKGKWGPDWDKTFQPPIYNVIPQALPIDDIEYVIRLHRLDEISRNLQTQNYEIQDDDIRSPSPEPEYDKNGMRTNTRINRAKQKLEREKNDLIEECIRLRKTFVPPPEYKPPKKSKKIFIPDETGWDGKNQYISLVLGPRGVTQKNLETKTKCKISVRGVGTSYAKSLETDSDEKLHILVQGETDAAVEEAALEVEKILRGDADEVTETEKAKQMQLQAVTRALGEDFCENCGERDHKYWQCPHKIKFQTAKVTCQICGDRSHPTADCPQKKLKRENAEAASGNLQTEFDKLIGEIDERRAQRYKQADKFQEPQTVRDLSGLISTEVKPVLQLAADPNFQSTSNTSSNTNKPSTNTNTGSSYTGNIRNNSFNNRGPNPQQQQMNPQQFNNNYMMNNQYQQYYQMGGYQGMTNQQFYGAGYQNPAYNPMMMQHQGQSYLNSGQAYNQMYNAMKPQGQKNNSQGQNGQNGNQNNQQQNQ